MTPRLPFFTIGHSNRSLDQFVALLGGPGVDRVVDVRTMPMSRANPQFNREALAEALKRFGISYDHVAALGGFRGKAESLAPEVNGFWTNESFHNYADYALRAEFHHGLERLLAEGRRHRCAIMCSEAVWWRCHRRIIGDYLVAGGETVFHIMAPGRLEPARLNPAAVVQPGGTLVYPAVRKADS
jgi:uncharacterized protein (DUF488 family)